MDTMDRRVYPRIPLPSPPRGLVDRRVEVWIRNLSPRGAMAEHVEPLRRGRSCVLLLELPSGDVRVGATVAWCEIAGTQRPPSGRPELCFRSGLHFSMLPEVAQSWLQAYLGLLVAPVREEEPAPAWAVA